MKYFLIGLFLLIGWIIYLSQTNILFLVEQKDKLRKLRKPIIYKNIKKVQEINGTYQFDCKTKWLTTYRNYEVGIEMKYKYLTTVWHKTNPTPWKKNYIKFKIIIQDKNNNIIYNKINTGYSGYGWGSYEQFVILDRFKVSQCKNIKFEIKFIDTGIENIPKDLMAFYLKVDERL